MRARGSTMYLKRESIAVVEEPEDLQSYIDTLGFKIDQFIENSNTDFGKLIDTTGTVFSDAKLDSTVDLRALSISTNVSRDSACSKTTDYCSWDELFDDVKPMKKFEVMIVGARGSGKRTCISSMFPQISMETSEKQPFDYLCRRVCEDKMDSIFKFWILESKSDLVQRDVILPIYYKKVQFFVFVYDVTKKDSLKELEPIIEQVLRSPREESLFMFLIGNIRKGEERQISYEEASEFKSRYGIAFFTESVIPKDDLSLIVDVVEDSCKVVTHC